MTYSYYTGSLEYFKIFLALFWSWSWRAPQEEQVQKIFMRLKDSMEPQALQVEVVPLESTVIRSTPSREQAFFKASRRVLTEAMNR